MKKYSYIAISTKDGKFKCFGTLVALGEGVNGMRIPDIERAAVRILADKLEIDPSIITVLNHTYLGDVLILD